MSTKIALVCAGVLCLIGASIINLQATVPAIVGCGFIFWAMQTK